MSLESFKENPLRYAVPWGMTLARPVIGADAMRQAWNGKWGRAAVEFAGAWGTDLEGFPARWLDAVTKAGAVADPIADGILRAESLLALAPRMPVTAGIVAANELYILKLNTEVQRGRSKPYVPMEAKIGTVLEGAGIVWTGIGFDRENVVWQREGQAALLSGVGLRLDAYNREARRMKLKV
jgi:hypothetical protein